MGRVEAAGGGGYDIHYGMFRTATDGVFESSKNTNAALLRLLDQTRPVTKDSVVLDLGSGHGGLSHEIAQTFGCKVISFNISPEQNQMNLDEAKRLGVGELISVRCGDFNDRANFPPSDLGEVTHVISCEVFCHAASKPNLLADVRKGLLGKVTLDVPPKMLATDKEPRHHEGGGAGGGSTPIDPRRDSIAARRSRSASSR